MAKRLNDSVPQSFVLGGCTIRVKIYADSANDKAGEWLDDENEIRLYPKGRDDAYMQQVFFHELFHAILDIWCRPADSKKERLIDALGHGLLQFTKTARY